MDSVKPGHPIWPGLFGQVTCLLHISFSARLLIEINRVVLSKQDTGMKTDKKMKLGWIAS